MNLTLTLVHKTKKTNKLYYPRDDPSYMLLGNLNATRHNNH